MFLCVCVCNHVILFDFFFIIIIYYNCHMISFHFLLVYYSQMNNIFLLFFFRKKSDKKNYLSIYNVCCKHMMNLEIYNENKMMMMIMNSWFINNLLINVNRLMVDVFFFCFQVKYLFIFFLFCFREIDSIDDVHI